ncbi:MAG TPA: maleylacetoacetate isomerase [Steroidobacteraceae bacterium]|nr:maleylacetoacetate isomerase [Steroidobacteraceae bacterium]
MLTLYTYYRSSAAFRVRIALQLKQLPYQAVPVHLLRNGGEQHTADYAARNPAELVPALDADGRVLTQSLAILEYLEESHPLPALLPADAAGRARVRALALTVACEIHPLNNLRVLRYLSSVLAIDEERRNAWYRHWIAVGFAALERTLQTDGGAGSYCHGDAPTFADCCLVPQVFNARRLQTPLDAYPCIVRIHDACMRLEAFRRAAPEAQPDAE